MLGEYTQLEEIDGFTCRHCSLVATRASLQLKVDADRAVENPTQSKKKRMRALRADLDKVKHALDYDIEGDLPGVDLIRTARKVSKQTMIARVSTTSEFPHTYRKLMIFYCSPPRS